jgi:hypothetical protein
MSLTSIGSIHQNTPPNPTTTTTTTTGTEGPRESATMTTEKKTP